MITPLYKEPANEYSTYKQSTIRYYPTAGEFNLLSGNESVTGTNSPISGNGSVAGISNKWQWLVKIAHKGRCLHRKPPPPPCGGMPASCTQC